MKIIGTYRKFMKDKKLILLVFTMIFVLNGCDYISTGICLVFNSKDKCVEKIFLNDNKNKHLTKGEIVFGDTALYKTTIPSKNWIKLPAAKNKKFPDRDLRLLHISGGSFIDVDVKINSTLPAKVIAINYLSDLMKLYDGDNEEVSTNLWDDVTIDNALFRFCFKDKNNRAGCFYTLVLKTTTNEFIFKGFVIPTEELINDLEEIFFNMKLNNK